jgi:hypothetical protein
LLSRKTSIDWPKKLGSKERIEDQYLRHRDVSVCHKSQEQNTPVRMETEVAIATCRSAKDVRKSAAR